MKAIILAGGLGTRLRSRVSELPKVLAPINDRPFLSIVLDQFVSYKFTEIVLSIGYLGEKIRVCFGENYNGMALRYIKEKSPLGTGGALAFVISQLESDNYFVLNGDTYLQLDYQKLYAHHLCSDSDITMTLSQVADTARYGQIEVENGTVTEFKEKGVAGEGLINAGVYVMSSNLFSAFDLPEKFSLETQFLQPNLSLLKPNAFITQGYFIDIGIPADFDRAQKELA